MTSNESREVSRAAPSEPEELAQALPSASLPRRGKRRSYVVMFARGLRDLWAAVGIALIVICLLNLVAQQLYRDYQEKVGTVLVNQPAFRATLEIDDEATVDQLAADIARTHDNPFEATASRWEPFVYWRSKTYDGALVKIGADGIRRSTRPAWPETVRPLRIFCFGGSTMWGSGVPDDETIPSQIAIELDGRGLKAETVNFGQPGYISTQEVLTLLLELQKGNIPDMVVFYDGFNDAGAGLVNDEPGMSGDEFERRAHYELAKRPDLSVVIPLYARHMALFRLFTPKFQESLQTRVHARLERTDMESLAVGVAHRYLRNIQTAQALADGFRFDVVYLWQPIIATRKQPAETEKPFLDKSPQGYHLALVELMRRIKQQIGSTDRAAGRLALLNEIFDGAPHDQKAYFFDECHLGAAGNRIVAHHVADLIEPTLRNRLANRANRAASR